MVVAVALYGAALLAMSSPRFISILLSLVLAVRVLAVEELRVLRTVQEVRALGIDKATRGYPVQLQGVITFSESPGGLHFIADSTGGVYLQVAGARIPRGKLVEIRGRTDAGLTVPFIDTIKGPDCSVVVLGEGPLPSPIPLEPQQLQDIRYGAQLVKIRGRVESVSLQGRAATVTISTGISLVQVSLPDFNARSTLPTYLQGFSVTATGVLGPSPHVEEVRKRFGEIQTFHAASLRDLEVDSQELEKRFAAAQPILEPWPPSLAPDAVWIGRSSGQIVYIEQQVGFFLSHARSAPWRRSVWVYSAQTADLKFGQHVEAVGKLDPTYVPVMRDAVVRPMLSVIDDRPPEPGKAFWYDPFEEGNALNGKLITVDLPLLSHHASVAGEQILILASEAGPIFGRVKQDLADSWRPAVGSLLRVTGVCVVKNAEDFGVNPAAFRAQLIIRSAADVQVLQAPPFWTNARLLWVVWSTLGVGVLALAWIFTLRRQVRSQMTVIGSQLEQHAIHEERARVAREWHDTLQQQLIGVSIQVQAAAAQCKQAPERATQMLQGVNAMLRHSQAEARRSVWNLRNSILEQRGLAEALKELRLSEPGQAQVVVRSEGDASLRLPADTEFHLLRIAQEAVANALQHSGATTIEVTLQCNQDAVTLSIADNGCGFDPAKVAQERGTHFGLLGMKERAAKINAQLVIDAAPANATTITVTAQSQNLSRNDNAHPKQNPAPAGR